MMNDGEKKECIFTEDEKNEIKEMYLEPLRKNKQFSQRKTELEGNRDRLDGEFQRDYTRILYSSSFRRLQGKMQLLGIKKDQFFRNRLTHSLEVAQIARSIAFKLGYTQQESYIVEAGALAHDLGNPPFGHAGERFLNEIAKKFGGFEGNAQTLRILTTVEQKRPDYQGLNLTNRTLFSVIKYFNFSDLKEKKEKFLYEEDYKLIKSIAEECGIYPRTLDVQIVDLADEIAYAAHDLEDGLRQGLFTEDEIILELNNLRMNKGITDNLTVQMEEIVKGSREKARYNEHWMDSALYSKLFRKELTSRVINTLINDIHLVDLDSEFIEKTGTMNKKELGFKNYAQLAKGLKKTTYECINHNDEVYLYEEKGEKIIQFLFDFYSNHNKYLPPEYRADLRMKQYDLHNCLEKDLQKRLIIDYISGMMDIYTETTYNKLVDLTRGWEASIKKCNLLCNSDCCRALAACTNEERTSKEAEDQTP